MSTNHGDENDYTYEEAEKILAKIFGDREKILKRIEDYKAGKLRSGTRSRISNEQATSESD